MPTQDGNSINFGNGLYGTVTARETQTIQTHNAVSIAPSGSSAQVVSDKTNANGFMDCSGYDQISLTLLNDATTASSINLIWSHDGVNVHGVDAGIPNASGASQRVNRTSIKAKWCKSVVINGDAATHTMSAWAYLIS